MLIFLIYLFLLIPYFSRFAVKSALLPLIYYICTHIHTHSYWCNYIICTHICARVITHIYYICTHIHTVYGGVKSVSQYYICTRVRYLPYILYMNTHTWYMYILYMHTHIRARALSPIYIICTHTHSY